MYQPVKFNARSSYTKHYTPKSAQGRTDAADLKDSMEMRPDMNLAYKAPPCAASKTTTYMRDFHRIQSTSKGRRASLSGMAPGDDPSKVGSGMMLRHARFDSVSSYQEQFKVAKLPNYSKTKVATLPPNEGIVNVPLEARTSYGAEFQSKRVSFEAPVTGVDTADADIECPLHGTGFDASTTYGGAFEGRTIDRNLVKPDDASVKSVDEIRSFTTENSTQYRQEGFRVPPKKISQCTCHMEQRELCAVHG